MKTLLTNPELPAATGADSPAQAAGGGESGASAAKAVRTFIFPQPNREVPNVPKPIKTNKIKPKS